MKIRKKHPFMFGLYGNEDENNEGASNPQDSEQDSSTDTSSSMSNFGQDSTTQSQPQTFGQGAADILKTIEMNSDLQPKDLLAPKPEPISEDE